VVETLEKAADAWRGDFAEGLDLPESPDFDEWLTVHREAWRGRMVAVLDRLSGLRADAGELERGLELARRWVAVDRYADPARRRVIELRLAAGDRPGALAEYEGFASLTTRSSSRSRRRSPAARRDACRSSGPATTERHPRRARRLRRGIGRFTTGRTFDDVPTS